MWIYRGISKKILEAAKFFPAILLTGARQTGKTSLFSKLFPNHHLVSLDLPSNADLAERSSEEFLKRYPLPLLIDEVQYAPKLFRYLKYWIDQNRSQGAQFLLTGSQKFALMKNISESLAGRCAIFELESLSLNEIQNSTSQTELETLLRGGYPELYEKPDMNPMSYYQSYLITYLERDVRTLLQVNRLRDFERFIRACAIRNAQILNKSDLARDIGISPTTANEWISVLEASGLIVLLEPWFGNKSKSLTKSPKLYFADTGLLCYLLSISTQEELLKSPLLGFIWECFVFSEIRKLQTFKNGKWNLYFWRNIRGLEVDFIIPKAGKFHAIETKFSERPDLKDLQRMTEVAQQLGKNKVEKMELILRTSIPYPTQEGIHVLPLQEWKPL